MEGDDCTYSEKSSSDQMAQERTGGRKMVARRLDDSEEGGSSCDGPYLDENGVVRGAIDKQKEQDILFGGK